MRTGDDGAGLPWWDAYAANGYGLFNMNGKRGRMAGTRALPPVVPGLVRGEVRRA